MAADPRRARRLPARLRGTAALALTVLLAGCARGATVESAAPRIDPGPAIIAMLQASAESWNRGDLDGFLDDYAAVPTTTFIGSAGVIRGVDEIRGRYVSGYWASGMPKDRLRFSDIEVRALGEGHALTVGRYILEDRGSGERSGTGFFSLVLERTATGWKIIHDHSSEAQ